MEDLTNNKRTATNILGDHLCLNCGQPCECCNPDHCARCTACYNNGTVIEHWSLSDRDGQTMLDARNRVVMPEQVLTTAKTLKAETASLRQQLSEARDAIVANYKGRVNGFDLARAWLRKYPLDSKEKHDNGD